LKSETMKSDCYKYFFKYIAKTDAGDKSGNLRENMKKPNFIILYPDSLGANALSCYGCKNAYTPNIDALAAGGVRMENCTSQNPVCMPSRASLLTGKYVSTHDVYDNGVIPYPVGHKTFQQLLKGAGYHTAYFGKTHSINNQEWDDVFDLYPDYNHYLQARGIDVVYPERFPLDKLNAGFSKIPGKDFSEVVLGNLAVDYIEKSTETDDPFLLFMSFEAPHSPWSLPEDYRHFYHPEKVKLPDIPEQDRRNKPQYRLDYHAKRASMAKTDENLKHVIAVYHALTSIVDEQVGRIVSALDSSGIRDNTCIILMSDHGDHLGNHRTMGKCLSIEEDLIHVPLILNNPKAFKPHVADALVESIDIFPTIMELANIDPPGGLQGQSLVPLAENRPDAVQRRASFSEEHYKPFPAMTSARNKEFKLIIDSAGFEELYNIKDDPHEWYNLAGQSEYKQVLLELKDEIISFGFMHVDMTLKEGENDNWVLDFMKPGFHNY
jgi:arylsulfatase